MSHLRKVKESNEQILLVRWLRSLAPDVRGVVTATLGETGGANGGTQVYCNSKMGYQRGMPDLLILKPCGNYHGAAIELKRTFNPSRVTPHQKFCIERLQNLGYYAAVAQGYWGARVILEYYLAGVEPPCSEQIALEAAERMPR